MHHRTLWIACLALALPSLGLADVKEDLQKASAELQPVMPEAGKLLADGHADEAEAKILAVFPEKTRTTTQALMLGNVLYQQDQKLSYALHKRAAAELADDPGVQLEWAMEQHRAGEYAAASDSYAKFVKANPDFGPALGMWAECLIRSGKTREAADAWERSEKGHGSIEQLESWVCEVHSHGMPDMDRAAFLKLAKTGDIGAAEKLIALDCDFEHDWWNAGPQSAYLKNDLAELRKIKFAEQRRFDAVQCAAECGIIRADEDGDAGKVLRKCGFLLDDKNTLPDNGAILSPMLAAAISSKAITLADARTKLGALVAAKAKASHDKETYNAAAYLAASPEEMARIDQEAWDAVGSERAAAVLIMNLAMHDKLAVNDSRLLLVQQQFPDNAQVAQVVVELTAKAGKPMQPALVNAIKAEYVHFSVNALSMRPSASALRGYFSALHKELAKVDK